MAREIIRNFRAVSIDMTDTIKTIFKDGRKLLKASKYDFNRFLIFISTKLFSVLMLNMRENSFKISSRGFFSKMTLQFLYSWEN